MADTFSRARTRLLLDNPFFGTLAMHWKVTATEAIETAQTNGAELRYNPKFLDSLSGPEQKGLLAHEVLHCALLHPYRRGSRDLKEWNIACDYVVNSSLLKAGFTLPKGGLTDPQFDDMSAEQVYSKRAADRAKQPTSTQQQPGPGQPQGSQSATGSKPGTAQSQAAPTAPHPGQGGTPGTGSAAAPGTPQQVLPGSPTGDFVDAPTPGTEGEGDLTEQDWKINVEQAIRVSSAAGEVPGALAGAIQGTREPKVDWITETRDFVTNTVPSNYSWTTPARRFIGQGIYLPGTKNENVGVLVVAVDSSGSTVPFVDQFTSEFRGILREARPEKVVLVYCDAVVQSAEEYLPDDFDAKLTVKGGGGTQFQPVFDYIEKEGIDPVALIYLTDLDNSGRVTEPRYPTLWVTPEYVKKNAPFGRVVRMQEVK